MLNGARSKRLHPGLVVSPALVAETPGVGLQLMCRKCMVPRNLDVTRSPKLRCVWTFDLERLFHHVTSGAGAGCTPTRCG